MASKKLTSIYHRLYKAFGPQHWWPADSAFEVAVGAILTQNTSWKNVERAIASLKKAHGLSVVALTRMSPKRLSGLIRSAGYHNVKARRLKNLVSFLHKNYQGSLNHMKRKSQFVLRPELLSVNGIGPETADSILLYALGKPVFVVDAYTKRIFARHHLAPKDPGYEALQDLFTRNLKNNVKLFNEYHALLVRLGKEFCLKNKARCSLCPLK